MILYVKEIKSYLDTLGKVIEKKNVIPILGHIGFRGGKMFMTDLDIFIEINIPNLDKDFIGTVEFESFKRIVDELHKDKKVSFDMEYKDGNVIVNKTTLESWSMDDFPMMSHINEAGSLSHADYHVDNLHKNVKELCPFILDIKKDNRYYLNGILFNGLDMVSTNGHALGRYVIGKDKHIDAIVPQKTCNILSKIKYEGRTRVIVTDTRVQFIYDNVIITSKLIDGHYPSYEQLEPEVEHTVMLDNKKLLNILKDIRKNKTYVVTEEYNCIALKFFNDRLEIHNKVGIINSLPIKSELDNITRAYNVNYLIDVLTSIDNDIVYIGLPFLEGSPCVIKKYHDFGGKFLLMPVKLWG